MEEELLVSKLTNQVFVSASSPVPPAECVPNYDEDNNHHSLLEDDDAQTLLCSLNAATFVSVVSSINIYGCLNIIDNLNLVTIVKYV